jgi:hypothetical protein
MAPNDKVPCIRCRSLNTVTYTDIFGHLRSWALGLWNRKCKDCKMKWLSED